MPTVRYTVAQGEVIAEKRGGTRSLYVPDPLGSTVALIDNTQTITDTWVYWPYGEVKTRTGTTATPFQYVGTQGYYHDSDSRAYVRARYLDKAKARWMTEDPIGFAGGDRNLYRNVRSSPVGYADPSGLDIGLPGDTPEDDFISFPSRECTDFWDWLECVRECDPGRAVGCTRFAAPQFMGEPQYSLRVCACDPPRQPIWDPFTRRVPYPVLPGPPWVNPPVLPLPGNWPPGSIPPWKLFPLPGGPGVGGPSPGYVPPVRPAPPWYQLIPGIISRIPGLISVPIITVIPPGYVGGSPVEC